MTRLALRFLRRRLEQRIALGWDPRLSLQIDTVLQAIEKEAEPK